MSRLSLNFLGLPEIRYNGQGVALPTRKTLALLIYLSVEGRAHSREKLVALLWPDSDKSRGRASLRLTLSFLRSALSSPELTSSLPLLIEHDTVAFDFASDFELDLHKLEVAAQAIRQAGGKVEVVDWPLLQAAVDVYRGDFLEGFSLNDALDFDDWASLQRESWRRRLSSILDHLSQRQFEGGELPGAIETTTRWVAHDPLNEMAHRRLMQLHFAAGDRAATLYVYETCRVILTRELNADPSPETESLADRIRDFELSPSNPQSRHRHASEIHNPKSFELPLVGRAAEHLALVTTFRTARRGRPQAVLLEGEPGIGKSRLIKEFLGWAAAQGADIWQGHAFETGGRLPYQPLIEALRQRLERENAPDDLLADVWLVELSRLLPELRERYPDLPGPAAEAAAPTRLFEAVARLSQALAQRSPLVLFLDDLQWADAASLDLLQYLSRRWVESGTPALLIFSARSEALSRASPLAVWLSGLGRDLPLTRLTLGPLTLDDTQRLGQIFTAQEGGGEKASGKKALTPPPHSATILSSDTLAQFNQRLFAETGGQPFFISEMLKSLLERNPVYPEMMAEGDSFERVILSYLEQGRSLELLPSVREVIQARLARLSPTALAILTAGSVLGHRFRFEEACGVANMVEEEGLGALDELLERGLLRESRIEFLFTHDRTREVVYANAGVARQRVLHRRALTILEQSKPERRAAELAEHALAAGLLERAFSLSVVAGDEAMSLFAVHNAINHYEQAGQLIENKGPRLKVGQTPSLPGEWYHLYTQVGRAYELTNQRDRARAIYQAMLTLAQETRRPKIECAALNHLATLAAQGTPDFESAITLLQQARRLAEKSGDKAGLAETEWNLALVGHYTWDLAETLAHSERALALARELGLAEMVARSLNAIALAKREMGKWAEAIAYAEEAHSLYVALGNRAMEADCLALISEAQIRSGHPKAGLVTARTAYTISLEIENIWGQAHSGQKIGQALLEMGEYREALKVVQASVAAARTAEQTILVILNLRTVGAIYRSLFALETARAIHLEALAPTNNPRFHFFAETMAAELCADCVLAGDWAEASTYARQALAAWNYGTGYAGLIRWYTTEALVRAGDLALAVEDIRRFGTLVGDDPRYRIPYLRSLAVLAQYEGMISQAITHLEEAHTLAEGIGLPGEQWPILAALGELYQACKAEGKRREAMSRASEIVKTLAAKIDDERLRTEFLAGAMGRL